jgi:hypothetical protein
VPTQRTAELAEYQIYIVSPVVASALLKIDVDLALLARKTKQAPLAGARRAVLEKTRTFPVRDAKLAPQALDLMDDEPRMSKETLAGRGQRDTTAIARQEIYPSFCCIHECGRCCRRGLQRQRRMHRELISRPTPPRRARKS